MPAILLPARTHATRFLAAMVLSDLAETGRLSKDTTAFLIAELTQPPAVEPPSEAVKDYRSSDARRPTYGCPSEAP